jgi:hypothetical protein
VNTVDESVVVIDDVTFSDPGDLIANFTIGHPLPASSEATYAIRFQGWVVGRHMPAVAVTINDGQGKHIDLPLTHAREDVGRLMPDVPWAGRSGFTAKIGALHLQQEFQLELTALMQDGSRATLGHVRGRRRRLPRLEGGRFTPVVLTTIGRSGSTWLTWMLGQHPELVAYRSFDIEPKGLAYFAELIRALSQPTSYWSALRGDIDNHSEWWGGFELRRGVNFYKSDAGTEQWLGTTYVESLLSFFASRLDELVGCLAQAEDKADARMFVEKLPPTFFGQLLWRELRPDMREVFLVRDPRDIACSILAFQRKRNRTWFERSSVRTEEEMIREPFGDGVGLLMHCWERRAAQSHLLRYEDLITDPQRSLVAVFEYLGVDASSATVAGVIERAGRLDDARRAWHITSPDAARSVGRWRNELSPALARACEEVCAPAMKAFGYQ